MLSAEAVLSLPPHQAPTQSQSACCCHPCAQLLLPPLARVAPRCAQAHCCLLVSTTAGIPDLYPGKTCDLEAGWVPVVFPVVQGWQ